MRPLPIRPLRLLLPFFAATGALIAVPSVVRVFQNGDSSFILTRNGQPYEIRGVGGDTHLETASRLGATTIRTWGAAQLDKKENSQSLLDRCQALDLTVMAGIWIQHERHGFDYGDPAQIKAQRETVRTVVRKYKDHPALLIWGLGNEMEEPMGNSREVRIWKELNELAKIVHEEDPNHPVATVIAGASPDKVRSLMANYTALDILGVNAYGSAPKLNMELAEAGWKKPFMLTEFGTVGYWEARTTSWGAPIEISSREKAAHYNLSHTKVMESGAGRCLGTFAFVWGHKQETTFTWFGMFLPSGEKLPSVDSMSYAWTHRWPANRSPLIETLDATFKEKEISPSTSATVTVAVHDAENDRLSYEWQIVEESADRKTGGDTESVPQIIPGCIVQGDGPVLKLRTPSRRGAYRVFCIIRDGQGGACADNFPFYVK